MNLKSSGSLSGKIVVITRSQEQQSEARKIFNRAGANVLDLPALVIGPPSNWNPLDNALLKIEEFSWLIFSSANGVKAVNERLKLKGDSLNNKSSKIKIAAVGRKTAASLRYIGVEVDFVPPEFVADSLIEHFPDKVDCNSILLPRVESGGRTFLADSFIRLGMKVLEVPAYESRCPDHIPENTVKALEKGIVHAIAFTSGKTVINTIELMGRYFGEDWNEKLLDTKIISIGPQTSSICKKYLGRFDQEANPHDLSGLVDACAKSLN